MSTLLSLIPEQVSLTSATAIVLPSSSRYSQSGKDTKNEQDEYTYSDLRSLVILFRKVLIEDLGVTKGDVVALSMANTLEFMIAFLATTLSRLVFISLVYGCPN